MPDWTISADGLDPVPARQLAARAHLPLTRRAPRRRTYLLTGSAQPQLAACAQAALSAGHRIVLLPGTDTVSAPGGTLLRAIGQTACAAPATGAATRDGWDVAMFSSGSTTGTPRGYGFTTTQLGMVASWYQASYQVTPDSIIVTALPAAYNFTFVAGVLTAARLGARLHLSPARHRVLDAAARLASSADRLIVLANPVILDQAAPTAALPANVLVDSGGAPLSITGISDFRDRGVDVREGYGLTETASLTHFDTEATATSLGTVGTAMPGVHTTITIRDGKPVIELTRYMGRPDTTRYPARPGSRFPPPRSSGSRPVTSRTPPAPPWRPGSTRSLTCPAARHGHWQLQGNRRRQSRMPRASDETPKPPAQAPLDTAPPLQG